MESYGVEWIGAANLTRFVNEAESNHNVIFRAGGKLYTLGEIPPDTELLVSRYSRDFWNGDDGATSVDDANVGGSVHGGAPTGMSRAQKTHRLADASATAPPLPLSDFALRRSCREVGRPAMPEIVSAKFRVGDCVYQCGELAGLPKRFTGRVTAVDRDGFCKVSFDDGEEYTYTVY